MSGFVLSTSPTGEKDFRRMVDAIRHRGELSTELSMVPVRAAVRFHDPAPPLPAVACRAEGFAVVVEGYVQNAAEIAAGTGKPSLGEGVAAAVRRDGVAALSRLEGEFAAAVVEEATGRVAVYRDLQGSRPVHYSVLADGLVVASEMKAITAHPSVAPRLDTGVLAHILVTGRLPRDGSICRGVFRVPPGHLLSWAPGRDVALERPRSPFLREFDFGFPDAVDEMASRFEETIRTRLPGDGKLTVLLSGGIDSYLVAEALARLAPERTKAVTLGTRGYALDETSAASDFARRLGLSVETLRWPSDFPAWSLLELLQYTVRILESPGRYGKELLMAGAFQKCAAAGVRWVIMSGDGADVVFGNSMYARFARVEKVRRLPGRRSLGKLVPLLRPVAGARATRAGSLLGMELDDPRVFVYDVPDDPILRRLVRFDPAELVKAGFRTMMEETRGERSDLRFSYVMNQCTANTVDYFERLISGHAADPVAPFLAFPVFELGFRLPLRHRHGRAGSKLVPKALAERTLPREVVWRKKRGFPVPRHRWLKSDPSLREGLASLRSAEARMASYVDRGAMVAALDAFEGSEGTPYADLLWILLSAELCCREFGL